MYVELRRSTFIRVAESAFSLYYLRIINMNYAVDMRKVINNFYSNLITDFIIYFALCITFTKYSQLMKQHSYKNCI